MTFVRLSETWAELVATAVLGTDRRPLPAVPPGPLEAFGTGVEPAVALLDRAAAVQAMRRSAAVPEAPGAPLVPCPADPRPACPTPAARRLGSMLEGRHADLLPEWLDTLSARGLALPPEHLLALMIRSDPEQRWAVVAAAGPVVGWLGSIFPRLAGAAPPPEDPVAAWERGTPAERIEALRLLRATDPAAARELLAGGLVGERAEHRAASYATLAVGLGSADEELLERALDDRSAVVRQVAAGLLTGLPSSAWAARMAERALGLVRVVGPPGQDRLDVSLVAPVPPAWERDGVSSAAPRGTSLGVHVLHQVVAGAPLAAWGAEPSHLVVLAAEHELGPVLLAGWVEAAVHQRDTAWARLLLDETGDPALVTVIEPADLRRAATRAASVDSLLTPLALAVLEAVPRPWPVELHRAVGRAVIELFADRRAGRHQGPLLRRLARALDPDVLPGLADALAALELPPPLDGVRDDLIDLVRFRAEMLGELTLEGTS